MKKQNKILEFLNSKGFYSALFTCLFAVLAIAAFVSIKNIDAISKLTTYGEADFSEFDDELQTAGVQMDKTVPELTAEQNNKKSGDDGSKGTNEKDTPEIKTEKSVEPQTQVKTEKDTPTPTENTKKQDGAGESAQSEQARMQNKSENADTETKKDTKTETKAETDTKNKDDANKKQDAANTDEPAEKKPESEGKKETAFVSPFEDGDEMSWPLDGAIVMDFSQTHAIYDKTLDQYRTNSTVSISSDVGTQVKAAADGIVKSISIDPRTGYTVVLDHGNGWQTTYAQLQETILVKEGQTVTMGQAIGGVGTPTKYGVLLGSHLVFGITKDDVPQNPKVVLIERNNN